MTHRAAILLTLCALAGAAAAAPSGAYWVHIGTYTAKEGGGIHLLRLDAAKGTLALHGLACETRNPGFQALHPSKPVMYSVEDDQTGGVVVAYALDPATGNLTEINRQSTVGAGPCHVSVTPKGDRVLVANYGGGSVASFPAGEDGALGKACGFMQHAGSSVNPKRQEGPHAHSIYPSPDGAFALAPDLGLDKVMIYRIDAASGRLLPNEPAFGQTDPGAGPRHMKFAPNGKFAYVLNELTNTVAVFAWDAKAGRLDPVQTISTLPEGYDQENTSAEIRIHPNGKHVYTSNRGHDSIAVFDVDEATGKLTAKGQVPTGGKTPRNFALDPAGAFLLAANQSSGTVVLFRVDPETGMPAATSEVAVVPVAVCVTFSPAP